MPVAQRVFSNDLVALHVAAFIQNFYVSAPALAQTCVATRVSLQHSVHSFRGSYLQLELHLLVRRIEEYQSHHGALLVQRDLDRQEEAEEGYFTD